MHLEEETIRCQWTRKARPRFSRSRCKIVKTTEKNWWDEELKHDGTLERKLFTKERSVEHGIRVGRKASYSIQRETIV